MVEFARDYPGYGWERNRGYGTPEHWRALHALGPTPLHRRSFPRVLAAINKDREPELIFEEIRDSESSESHHQPLSPVIQA
jgi:ribonuclease HII